MEMNFESTFTYFSELKFFPFQAHANNTQTRYERENTYGFVHHAARDPLSSVHYRALGVDASLWNYVALHPNGLVYEWWARITVTISNAEERVGK